MKEAETSETPELSSINVEVLEEQISSGESSEKILGLENGMVSPKIFELLSLTSQF